MLCAARKAAAGKQTKLLVAGLHACFAPRLSSFEKGGCTIVFPIATKFRPPHQFQNGNHRHPNTPGDEHISINCKWPRRLSSVISAILNGGWQNVFFKTVLPSCKAVSILMLAFNATTPPPLLPLSTHIFLSIQSPCPILHCSLDW